MNSVRLWQNDIFKCFILEENQQNFYGKNGSCLLKIQISVDISTHVIHLIRM